MDKEGLITYDAMLMQHDWFYRMSDDLQVYRNGQAALERLQQMATECPEAQRLFDIYEKNNYLDSKARVGRDAVNQVRLELGIIDKMPPPPPPPLVPGRGKHLLVFDVQLKFHDWNKNERRTEHWHRTVEENAKLRELAGSSPEHAELFKLWRRLLTEDATPPVTEHEWRETRVRLGVYRYDPEINELFWQRAVAEKKGNEARSKLE